jgi:hypothetical protein
MKGSYLKVLPAILTADFCKRVVFGDLLLHLGCDLWFSFCTARDRPGTKTEP